MSTRQSRRTFLKTVAAGAGAIAGTRIIGAPYILADKSPNSKLGCVVIGCGGRGTGTHVPVAARDERLVALVDADEKNLAKALEHAKKSAPDLDESKVRLFTDYRKMYDEIHKDIDAVFIATPNHQHCLPSLMAMKLGKGVYVEKPMAYDIHEARQMAEWSKKYKVATQMGNQGHSGEGYRRFCEYIWAGAIGNVTEVYCWSDRANGGVGPRPPSKPAPAGMNWDSWIGPAPYREFHDDLHPHEWHGWFDFGDGSLGNMGAHILDGPHWALKLGHPTSIEVEELLGGSNERYPTGTKIRWDYPARGDMPPVKVYWFDGKRKGVKNAGEGDVPDAVGKEARNRPPLVIELEAKYKRDFGTNGSLYVGDKGIMFTGCYGDSPRIVPEEAHQAFHGPPKTIPRIKEGHQGDFLRACRGGEPAVSNFVVAAPLTEMILLGCLAIRAGAGKKLEWNGAKMKCTNNTAVNQYLQRENRKGWTA